MRREKQRGIYLLIFFLAALLTGCGGPLQYVYTPSSRDTPAKSAQGPSIYITPVRDNRKDVKNLHKIGELRTTVLDIYGTELLLSEKPAEVVRGALITEFTRGGFKVSEGSSKKNAEYILKAKLLKFRLDIASKDTIDIALHIEIIKAGTNTKAWSGVVEVSDSRYAGVSGPSRRTITRYITASLKKVIQEAVSQTEAAIKEDLSTQRPSNRVSISEKRDVQKQKVSTGLLRITTDPVRAKIYLNGIYYGLSPQTLHLKPEIYNLEIKKDGFFEYREKVAVDKARETEIEERLRKRPQR